MKTTKQPRITPWLGRGLAILALAASALPAWSHGYVSSPESRGLLCQTGGNSNCGPIQYEPQSLEGPSGYPARGPADGQLASAGLSQFSTLNEQTASRWTKRSIKAGANNFVWTFTANHATRNWRYYITRAGWNPNQVLSRASFESTPFCQVDGGGRQPPKTVTHSCTVPPRSGYQVVLAVWEVADTTNSFYNLLDLMVGDAPVYTWSAKGTIYPSVDLSVGDKVSTRVFDTKGERSEFQTRITVASASEGVANNWAYKLASQVNAEQVLLRAGQQAADGSISPVYGQNSVFVRNDSGLDRVEIQIDKAPPPNLDVLVSGLASEYTIVGGKLSIAFNVTAVGELDVSATVFDAAGVNKGSASVSLNNSGQTLTIALNQPAAGAHQLVVKGTPKAGGTVIQKTYALTLKTASTAYDYVFPNGLASYKAGTRVLQNKTGRVYECKPFPYSGWCSQWSANSTAYEPGVGAHWADAWTGL
ncbi:N-acetylglucosamine-binding protein GbpA [Paucibacter sp. APW11]|uniref:N-acetylglucosamine-binding protein GbpA n=1 Tax=Roseateles aquae TaxID=3077235 RepID=A0ABU3PFW4_9BURK|nr:N-acetylglucosamine-binding protein GbpA [Paucibacter sp. APW11]MDT9001428.1 N-acetylglucosamine-binding protein GbpA [Paucibacter sp. APW11]